MVEDFFLGHLQG